MNLHDAKRPVLVFGAGIHHGHAENEARELADLLQIPVCLTWAAADIVGESDPLRIGTFGTHGTRAANFAVQNSDYLLCVGTRLDTKATGTPAKWFAREATIVMVDIDQAELDKMTHVGVKVQGVCIDAKLFMSRMTDDIEKWSVSDWRRNAGAVNDWRIRCQDWKRRYPVVLPEYQREESDNPYVLIRELSLLAEPSDIITSDTGCALAWCMQAWEFKEGQRFLHAFNQTPMGYGLPAAIGAHYATGKRVICVTGDGSIMMSIGELATIGGNKLPIKIVLLENGGHAMCRQSEREWFGGKYCATSRDSGLTFPDFVAVAEASGIEAEKFCDSESVVNAFISDDPYLLEVAIHPDHDVVPKGKAGDANENQYPYLPREVLEKEMLIGLAK